MSLLSIILRKAKNPCFSPLEQKIMQQIQFLYGLQLQSGSLKYNDQPGKVLCVALTRNSVGMKSLRCKRSYMMVLLPFVDFKTSDFG